MTDEVTSRTDRPHGVGISPEPPHGSLWAEVPAAAEMNPDDRDRWLYRVASEVARRVSKVHGWRTHRSGVAVSVWTGPDRQRCRHPDYTIWIENEVDRHLHRPTATQFWDTQALDEIADILRTQPRDAAALDAIADAVKGTLRKLGPTMTDPTSDGHPATLDSLRQQVQQARDIHYEQACEHGEAGQQVAEARAYGRVAAYDEVLAYLAAPEKG